MARKLGDKLSPNDLSVVLEHAIDLNALDINPDRVKRKILGVGDLHTVAHEEPVKSIRKDGHITKKLRQEVRVTLRFRKDVPLSKSRSRARYEHVDLDEWESPKARLFDMLVCNDRDVSFVIDYGKRADDGWQLDGMFIIKRTYVKAVRVPEEVSKSSVSVIFLQYVESKDFCILRTLKPSYQEFLEEDEEFAEEEPGDVPEKFAKLEPDEVIEALDGDLPTDMPSASEILEKFAI